MFSYVHHRINCGFPALDVDAAYLTEYAAVLLTVKPGKVLFLQSSRLADMTANPSSCHLPHLQHWLAQAASDSFNEQQGLKSS